MHGVSPAKAVSAATPRPPTLIPASSDSILLPIRIVPKGLGSFDENDADFFLELLPGPRDRDGFPEGLRFWKTRIEATDPDRTFRVGLIYGPSGCGKSSMVKAGLLPARPARRAVYVESTGGETESRLLRGLRKRLFPACPPTSGWSSRWRASGAAMGCRRTARCCWSWTSSSSGFSPVVASRETELVAALRQCDGEHSRPSASCATTSGWPRPD